MDGVNHFRGRGDGAGNGIAVAIHKLCHGTDDNIGPLIQRPDGNRGGKCVVDHQIRAIAMSNFSQGRNIRNV